MTPRGLEALRWTAGGPAQPLGDLAGGSFFSKAFAVSRDGSVVVGQSASDLGGEAFRWTADAGMVGLGVDGIAFAVSADGSVIVGQNTNSGEAFIWDARHGARSLGSALAAMGVDARGWDLQGAFGISADGTVITGIGYDPSGSFEGWVAQVPEPAAVGAACLAALTLLGRRRRS